MHFKLFLSLALAGLAVLFVIQNVAVVEVRLLLWGLRMTLSVLIFLLFAGGLIGRWSGSWTAPLGAVAAALFNRAPTRVDKWP